MLLQFLEMYQPVYTVRGRLSPLTIDLLIVAPLQVDSDDESEYINPEV